jgi:hypothetical protein
MRASISSTREPMKPESRPSSEQGLASAVNLAGAFLSGIRLNIDKSDSNSSRWKLLFSKV